MTKIMKSLSITVINIFLCCVIIVGALSSCSNEDNPLIPYVGSPNMSDINIEQASFLPAVTWVGGYVAVFGVNYGSEAALDSSLVWLIYAADNGIQYPVNFGQTPQGAQDLTVQYGGTKISTLSEDNTYTFWVMKEDAWSQLKNSNGKFVVDSTSSAIVETNDTIKIPQKYFVNSTLPLDVFVNISGISTFGRLADISITEDLSNFPIIDWTIKQTGVTDSKISAIGITEGGQFTPTQTVWEVYSTTEVNGSTVYGKKNVISGPLNLGDNFDGTHVFYEFPESGLERNKTYYIWIANENWDGSNRLRFADGYAFATFSTK
ncbi:MAG: hypothetical protein KJ571_12895 [Bacteroidetes bacterium]|nr:hypothetical protein [Bacteroidota bacterium]